MGEHPKGYCPLFGNYPKEYNKAVHGPYYPWVNYGPRDTPFYEVKLGEMKTWLSRRNKAPWAALAVWSRYWSQFHYKWSSTRFGSPTIPFFQFAVLLSTTSMFGMYGLLKQHRSHKYHW